MADVNPLIKPAAQDAFLSAADLKGLIEKQQQANAAKEKKHKEEEQAAKKALMEELMIPVQVTEQLPVSAMHRSRTDDKQCT